MINVDRGFVSRREDFQFQPGIFDVARKALSLGLTLVVVTNQSGIGLGYYSEDDFRDVTEYMQARFKTEGAPIEAVYHCPYHPEAIEAHYRFADHPWRKPRPGMILAARDDLNLDLGRSVLIGDRHVDIEAGAVAGVGTLVLLRPADLASAGLPPYHHFTDLSRLPAWLERTVV